MTTYNTTNILRAAHKHRMFKPGDKVLVAVSGGPDSIAMLHALLEASDKLRISIHIAHLNHGIRGRQSNLDEDFVRNLARLSGLAITTKRVDIPSLRAEMRVGEEEAARIVRHEFLQETAKAVGADKIAIGHTADDRAESVLLNIIRGCGVDGIGSIRPISGNIVRPLIEATRKDIEQYIREHALPYRIDESNADTAYSRNRVRHKLIPTLEREFNSEIRKALVRLAGIAAVQSDLMETLSSSAIRSVTRDNALDVGLFNELPEALQYETVRSEIARLKGDLVDVTFEQIERIVEALHSNDDFTITLPSGAIYAVRKGNKFSIARRESIEQIEPFDHTLQIPGSTTIQSIGLTLDCSIIDNPTVKKLTRNEAIIDSSSIVGVLRIRSIEPGDRITPFGMTGSKKLQDIFVDKKIPKQERARAAVVTDDEKILWVVGVTASELGKVTNGTGKAIYIAATHK